MNLIIKEFQSADFERIAATEGGAAWKADFELWTQYSREQKSGERIVLLGTVNEQVVAYGTLKWISNYAAFSGAGIPEINNLVVAQTARQQGIATQLIARFEQLAREANQQTIGIGVGLYADYGPAQRLYIKLGFQPDGNGITHNDLPVQPGKYVRVDDDLVLWMKKSL